MLRIGLLFAACLAIHIETGVRQALSQSIDLRRAQVVVPADLSGPENKSVELLVDEIQARTRLQLSVANAWPDDLTVPVIALGPVASLKKFGGSYAQEFSSEQQLLAEGFRIRTIAAGERAPAILIVGNDSRGVLFG
ncbi:MAG TPA: hypothetical protein VHK01_03610, partial [Lacipirellulaceae bacterium]|nr:hypothetical protein [Lacipirellulaceae bacterium]